MELEALRILGVTLNSLEQFMGLDDLVVLEVPEMSEEKKTGLLLRAFRQMGKPYDFNFNVESGREWDAIPLAQIISPGEQWMNALIRYNSILELKKALESKEGLPY